MDNPYTDEPYQTAWQQGHDYGGQNPSDESPQTPDFSSWGYDGDTTDSIGTVWQEGALAGRNDSSSSAGSTSPDGGATAQNDTDAVTLDPSLAAELADLWSQFPETYAMMQCADGDSYFSQVVALDNIPTSDDNEVA